MIDPSIIIVSISLFCTCITVLSTIIQIENTTVMKINQRLVVAQLCCLLCWVLLLLFKYTPVTTPMLIGFFGYMLGYYGRQYYLTNQLQFVVSRLGHGNTIHCKPNEFNTLLDELSELVKPISLDDNKLIHKLTVGKYCKIKSLDQLNWSRVAKVSFENKNSAEFQDWLALAHPDVLIL